MDLSVGSNLFSKNKEYFIELSEELDIYFYMSKGLLCFLCQMPIKMFSWLETAMQEEFIVCSNFA